MKNKNKVLEENNALLRDISNEPLKEKLKLVMDAGMHDAAQVKSAY